jgi:hypothetical protein
VLQLAATSASAIESSGWLRYRLDQVWHIPYRDLTPADIAAGGLSGLDVLLVPNGPAAAGYNGLGAAGRAALSTWVNAGGRYVGWRGGTVLAAQLGLTTATLTAPTSDVPGSLLRVKVDESSPLAANVGPYAWSFYEYDNVMRAADPADVVVSYPAADSPEWFTSGYQSGAAELGGTASVVDEVAGTGRVVVFAGEPNFRAFTDGTAKVLFNAIVGPAAAAAAAAQLPAERAAARRSATALPKLEEPIRVSVRPGAAGRTAAVLRGLGATWTESRTAERVAFLIDNPRGLSLEEHPWARELPAALDRAKVRPIAVVLP